MGTHPVTVSLAIKADPQAIWTALTDGTVSPAYYYGFSIESSFTEGAPYTYTAGGAPMITGTVTEVAPAESMTMTFHGVWDPGVAELPETIVRYELAAPAMPMPGVTVLTMTHTGMPAGDTAHHVAHGWVLILSGLKTLVETGEPLATPPGS